jgi:hypothetical protein
VPEHLVETHAPGLSYERIVEAVDLEAPGAEQTGGDVPIAGGQAAG